MGKIYAGLPEIGIATRDAMTSCATFDCMHDTISAMNTVVPMYIIMAGTEANQGVVISKNDNGVANERVLDDDTWYLLQTNDDHFDGICQQRCVDGKANMEKIG